MCRKAAESLDHLLLHCPVAFLVGSVNLGGLYWSIHLEEGYIGPFIFL